jgi:hypothetical protein
LYSRWNERASLLDEQRAGLAGTIFDMSKHAPETFDEDGKSASEMIGTFLFSVLGTFRYPLQAKHVTLSGGMVGSLGS